MVWFSGLVGTRADGDFAVDGVGHIPAGGPSEQRVQRLALHPLVAERAALVRAVKVMIRGRRRSTPG